jgi:hypothetical protein
LLFSSKIHTIVPIKQLKKKNELLPFLLQGQKGERIMQEHEIIASEEITEDDLDSVNGGCDACATDHRIINATTRIATSAEILREHGAEVPAHIMTREDIRQAYADGFDAMQRVNQRHPGTFDLPPGLHEAVNIMNQRRPGRRN